MSTTNVFSIFGEIALDDADYNRALDAAERNTDRAGRNMQGKMDGHLKRIQDRLNTVGRQLQGFGTRMSTGVTAPLVAAAGAATAFASKMASAADAVDKGSQAAGVGAERYQTLRFAFDQSGIGADQFNMSLTSLSRRLGLAAQGQASYAQAFEQLGVSVRDTNGNIRDTEDVFDDAIAALARLPSAAEQAATASVIFGDDVGKKLVPVLSQGTAGLAELEQKARDLGIVMGEDAITTLVAFKDDMGGVQQSLQTAGVQIAASFVPLLQDTLVPAIQQRVIPALRSMAERIAAVTEWWLSLSDGAKRVVGGFVGILAAIGPVTLAIGATMRITSALIAVWATLGTAAAAITTAFRTGTIAVAGMNLALWPIIGTVVAVGAAVALFAAAYNRNWLGIGDATRKAMDWIGAQYERISTFIRAVVRNLDGFHRFFGNVFLGIGAIAEAFATEFPNIWNLALLKAYHHLATFGQDVNAFFIGLINDRILGPINRLLERFDAEPIGAIVLAEPTEQLADLNAEIAEGEAAWSRLGEAVHAESGDIVRDAGLLRDAIAADMEDIRSSEDEAAEGAKEFGESMDEAAEAAATLDGALAAVETTAKEADPVEVEISAVVTNVDWSLLEEQSSRRVAQAAAEDARIIFERVAADAQTQTQAWRAFADEGIVVTAEILRFIEALPTAAERAAQATREAIRATFDEELMTRGMPGAGPGHAGFGVDVDAILGDRAEAEREAERVEAEGRRRSRAIIFDFLHGQSVAIREAQNEFQREQMAAQFDQTGRALREGTGGQHPGFGVPDLFAEQAARDAAIFGAMGGYDPKLRTGSQYGERGSQTEATPATPVTLEIPVVTATIQPVVDEFADTISILTGGVQQGNTDIENFGAAIVGAAADTWPVSAAMAGLETDVNEAGETIVTGFNPMTALADVFGNLLGRSEAFQALLETINGLLDPLVRALDPLFNVLTRLLEALSPVVEVLGALLEGALSPLVWVLENVVVPVFRWVADAIKTVYNALFGWLFGKIEEQEAKDRDEDVKTYGTMRRDKEGETQRGFRFETDHAEGTVGYYQDFIRAAREHQRILDDPATIQFYERWIEDVEDLVAAMYGRGEDAGDAGTVPEVPEPGTGAPIPQAEFGNMSQAVQLAAAAPMLEAAYTMMDAATSIQGVFGRVTGGGSPFADHAAAMRAHTAVMRQWVEQGIDVRTGAVQDRLAREGLSRYTGPMMRSTTAHLRGL